MMAHFPASLEDAGRAREQLAYEELILLGIGMKHQCRCEVVIPGTYKSEDCLYCDCRLHQRYADPVKGLKLVTSVDSRCLDERTWQVGLHVLLHVEVYDWRCNGWDDEWCETIIHSDAIDQT